MKKKRRIFAPMIVVVVVIVTVIAAGAVYLWKWPQMRISRGLLNLTQELAQYENPVLVQADLERIWQELQEGATHTIADVEVALPDKENNLLGLKLDKSIDKKLQLLKTTGEISLFEKEILNLEVAMEGNDLYLSLPAFSSRALLVDADRVVSGFNTSILAKLTGWELPEDYLQMIFGQMTEGMESVQHDGAEDEGLAETGETVEWAGKLITGALSVAGLEIEEAKEESIRSFLKDISITDLNKTITLEAKQGQIAADGYCIEIPGEPLNQMLSKVGEMMDKSSIMKELLNDPFGDRVKIEIYLDKDNRIVRMSTVEALADQQNREVELVQFDLLGEERTVDAVTGILLMKQDQQETQIQLSWNGSLVDGGCITDTLISRKTVQDDTILSEEAISLSSEWAYVGGEFGIEAEYVKERETKACDVQGRLTDIVSGNSIRVQVESMEVFNNEEEVCKLAGSYFVEFLNEDIIMPTEYVDSNKIFH